MELLIIGGIAVLIFGNKLPGIARSVGRSFVEFKQGLKGIEEPLKDVKQDITQAARDVNESIKS